MNMQNVSNLQIPEGVVRTIHDKNNRLIWGRLNYDTKYAGDTAQNGTPTPDAPVVVQTVTGQQTVTVHGKNMFNPALLSQVEGYNTYNSATGLWTTSNLGSYYRSIFYDAASSGGNRDVSKIVGPLTANTTYTVKLYDFVNNTITTSRPMSYALFHSDNTVIAGSNVRVESFFTFTTPDEACYLDIRRLESGGTVSFSKIMIIEGTYTEQTMPSYEPYQSQPYTVNLGSIELCKLGTYQDYIYKSGSDWYVHKEIQKLLVDGVNTKVSSQHNIFGGINGFRINISSVGDLGYTDMLSDNFNYIAWGTYQSSDRQYGEITATTTASTTIYVTQPNSTTGTTFDSAGVTSMNTWFSNHNTLIYYVLATATDTQITDATLIGQLNAVHEWLTRYGYNATVSGNLPLIVDRTNL